MARFGSGTRLTLAQGWRVGLFLGGLLLAAGAFLFSHWAIGRLTVEVENSSRLLARFLAQVSFPATRNPELEAIVPQITQRLDFPVVVTDMQGYPRAWRAIDVTSESVPVSAVDSLSQGYLIAPEIAKRVERVRERSRELDRRNPPIPMTTYGAADTLGWVHYGEPPVLGVLRWMPYLSVGGTLLLVGLGFWGLATVRQAERRSIWVGMAKETAHQLGTPLSSLMGWTELLHHRVLDAKGPEIRVSVAELSETVGELRRDIDRLGRVAERFSNIGSEPKLERLDPCAVVSDAVSYMRHRLPQGETGAVDLRVRYDDCPHVRINAELLHWSLENLITNAVSALDGKPGIVEVSVGPSTDRKSVDIQVKDTGRGMSPREQRKAFDAGYTTKRRGWGLGLALARRVVEDYHGGKIWIRRSATGQGSTLAIRLPAAD